MATFVAAIDLAFKDTSDSCPRCPNELTDQTSLKRPGGSLTTCTLICLQYPNSC